MSVKEKVTAVREELERMNAKTQVICQLDEIACGCSVICRVHFHFQFD